MKQSDILIIGGGVAGLTLAILLAEKGVSVSLVDPAKPSPLSDAKLSGRTVALMENSLNIIRASGVWDEILEHCTPLKAMRIIDDSAARKTEIDSKFPAQDIGMDQFGYNVPNSFLHAALWDKAKTIKGLALYTEQKLYDYEASPAHITARLENSTEITAKLIIGADGRESLVRKIAGIDVVKRPYDQAAITCVINHSRSHNNTATEFHRPGGPLALVPLPGNQCSVVWVNQKDKAETIIALKKQDFESTLQDASNDVLGGITLDVNPQCWPLCSIKAKTLTAPRTALMAEAAHVMSPITAQGLNLSLRDVAALAEVIMDAMLVGIDPGHSSMLETYAKRRKPDIETRVLGVDSMNRIVSQDIEWLKGIRRAGLKAVESVPPLKRFAMNHGLAPQIDLGRLARGEAL